jgi:iron-sulfur cluster assembly protein
MLTVEFAYSPLSADGRHSEETIVQALDVNLTVTEAAAAKTKALLQQRGMAEQGALRVFIVGGGCSGYQYGMALAAAPEEGDLVVERGGVRVVVDPDSARMLDGAEVDYTEDIMKSGFSIFNPNAVKSCACGTSFQTADGTGTPRACS